MEERREKLTVYKILNYLLENGVLKKDSVEGMDEHFPVLEKILRDHLELERQNYVSWLNYWASGVHRSHTTQVPDNKNIEDCINEYCISILQTIRELN